MEDTASLTLVVELVMNVAYMCPVCDEPVCWGEPDHPHLEDYLDLCQG